jgi:putative transposase
MVHLVRNSVAFVSYKDRKAVCADLKAIYSAATEVEAQTNLELFADSPFSSGGKPSYRNGSERWDRQYPSIPCGKQAIARVREHIG